MENNQDKSIGPIIGTLVIVIVLFIAAIYVFAAHVSRQSAIDDSLNATSTIQYQTITNSADDVQSLKADLNNSVK
jgi:uncharacterized membrane protein YukC